MPQDVHYARIKDHDRIANPHRKNAARTVGAFPCGIDPTSHVVLIRFRPRTGLRRNQPTTLPRTVTNANGVVRVGESLTATENLPQTLQSKGNVTSCVSKCGELAQPPAGMISTGSYSLTRPRSTEADKSQKQPKSKRPRPKKTCEDSYRPDFANRVLREPQYPPTSTGPPLAAHCSDELACGKTQSATFHETGVASR